MQKNFDVVASLMGDWAHSGEEQDAQDAQGAQDAQDAQGASSQSTPSGITHPKTRTEQFLDKVEDAGYDLTYIKPILESTGNVLINAAAGSGKTTALVLKLYYDFVNGRMLDTNEYGMPVLLPVWVGTFLKSGQKDLSKQISRMGKRLGMADLSTRVVVNTLHAEFYQVCKLLGYSADVISDEDNKKLFVKALRDYGFRYSTAEVDSEYSRVLNMRGSMNVAPEYVGVLNNWKSYRFSRGLIDFEDMQEILYNAAVKEARPEVRDLLSTRYRRCYFDEAQDVSKIQYEILKVYGLGKGLAKDSGNIVEDRSSGAVIMIGDDDQSIYSWRGSDISILTRRYPEDFNASVYQNPVNYRTPQGILEAVIPCIEKNENRFDKPLKSAKKGGVLRYGEMSDFVTMGKTLASLVDEDTMRGKSVAVLVRTNSDGVVPAMALASEGIDFSLSSSEMTLNGSVGNSAQGVIDLVNNGTGALALKALGDLISDSTSVEDNIIVEAMRKYIKESNTGIWGISDEDLKYSLPDKVATRLIAWKTKYNKTFGGSEVLVDVLEYLIDKLDKGRSASPWNLRRCAVFMALRNMAISEGPDSKISDVSRKFGALRDVLSSKYESFKRGYSRAVEIATVHEYKGREAQSVYVWNASKGVFPNKLAVASGKKEDYEEERRIFYIACTRAREMETVFSLKGSKSPFLQEMDLSKAKGVEELSSVRGHLGIKSARGAEADPSDGKLTPEDILNSL